MISDSTALIHLARIGRLDLLKKSYGVVTIPSQVKKEIMLPDKEGHAPLNQAVGDWVNVEEPQKVLDLGLGKGEEAAMSLALTKSSKLILDDAKARKAARSLGIETIRTTTVLFQAVKKGILDKKEALEAMDQLIDTGYYVSPRIYKEIVKALS